MGQLHPSLPLSRYARQHQNLGHGVAHPAPLPSPPVPCVGLHHHRLHARSRNKGVRQDRDDRNGRAGRRSQYHVHTFLQRGCAPGCAGHLRPRQADPHPHARMGRERAQGCAALLWRDTRTRGLRGQEGDLLSQVRRLCHTQQCLHRSLQRSHRCGQDGDRGSGCCYAESTDVGLYAQGLSARTRLRPHCPSHLYLLRQCDVRRARLH